MKKEILDALRVKFAGVADTILDRIAEKLAKTADTEEKVKEAVDSYTIQMLLDSNGDYRATEASQTAVKNYEKRYNLKDGQTITVDDKGGNGKNQPIKPAGGNKDDENIPAWALALIEQSKAITEKVNRMDADKIASDRKTRLDATISKLPESLRKAYGHTSLEGSDEEFNAMLTTIAEDVSKMSDTLKAKGVVFKAPGSSNAGGDKDDLTEAQLKAISTRQGAPASDAQPF